MYSNVYITSLVCVILTKWNSQIACNYSIEFLIGNEKCMCYCLPVRYNTANCREEENKRTTKSVSEDDEVAESTTKIIHYILFVIRSNGNGFQFQVL